MLNKPLIVFIFLLVLLNVQFLLVTPSFPKKTIQEEPSSPQLKQSSVGHTYNITTVNKTIQDWDTVNSPVYYLHFGDIIMVNFTSVPLSDPNSGVILYLYEPLNFIHLTGELHNYSTYLFPALGQDQEGNYSFSIFNPGAVQGGDPINVTATFTFISNSPGILMTPIQNLYINDTFNFDEWHPSDANNDTMTFDIYNEIGSETPLALNATNPTYFMKLAIENVFGDQNYILKIVVHDFVSVLNLTFTTESIYTMSIYVDKINPSISGHPQNITIDKSQTNVNLTWNAWDQNPTFYNIYKNGSLVNTSTWHTGDQVYTLGKLDVGTYNYTIVMFDRANNSNSVFAIVTVKNPGSFHISGFEFISILAIPVITFIYRRKKT